MDSGKILPALSTYARKDEHQYFVPRSKQRENHSHNESALTILPQSTSLSAYQKEFSCPNHFIKIAFTNTVPMTVKFQHISWRGYSRPSAYCLKKILDLLSR